MRGARRYGLLSGLVFALCLFTLSLAKNPDQETINYAFLAGFPFMLFCLIMAMRKIRRTTDKHFDFGEAFKVGLGVSAIAGLINGLANYIYFKWINSELVSRMAEAAKPTLIKQNLSPEIIQERLDTFMSHFPFTAMTYRFVMTIFIGAVLSLILALFLRQVRLPDVDEPEIQETP
jgi:hypothetical protein